MTRISFILVVILFIITGCTGSKQPENQTDGFITVDVTKTSYPRKGLILQDFMDVEYIPLETNDDFLTQGVVMAIGKEIILIKNRNRDGDIFVFNRKGKAIRKINHRGQGGEEYTDVYRITLDESNDEMFVSDFGAKKILVYDLYGNYKRSLRFKEEKDSGSLFYNEIFNYDINNLICYDTYNKEIAFLLISKQDGSITKEIKIPFQEKKFMEAKREDGTMIYITHPGYYSNIIPYKDNWILLELSSDTVFSFLPDYSLRPFIVRTPPIQSMDPEVFLILRGISDRYYFMETIKNVYDWNKGAGFTKTFIVYDNQENDIFSYSVYNNEYINKLEVYNGESRGINQEIASWQSLEAFELVDAYKNGELKGELKEIAAKLNEDSNPVIMLLKHKK